MKNIKTACIVLPICFVVVVGAHKVLNVHTMIGSRISDPIIGVALFFENMALLAIFGGLFIDHIERVTHIFGGIEEGKRPREGGHKSKKGFSTRELFLAIGAVSFSVGVYVVLKSVTQ